MAGTFNDCTSLNTVLLHKGITEIGVSAFKNCNNLVDITLPEGVTKINNFAFQNCTTLLSIDLPASLKEIKLNAFVACKNLSKVKCHANTPPTVMKGAFRNSYTSKELLVPSDAISTYKTSSWMQEGFTNINAIIP